MQGKPFSVRYQRHRDGFQLLPASSLGHTAKTLDYIATAPRHTFLCHGTPPAATLTMSALTNAPTQQPVGQQSKALNPTLALRGANAFSADVAASACSEAVLPKLHDIHAALGPDRKGAAPLHLAVRLAASMNSCLRQSCLSYSTTQQTHLPADGKSSTHTFATRRWLAAVPNNPNCVAMHSKYTTSAGSRASSQSRCTSPAHPPLPHHPYRRLSRPSRSASLSRCLSLLFCDAASTFPSSRAAKP